MGPNDDVAGVKTFFGVTFRCKSLVLTTGTFMARLAPPAPPVPPPAAPHRRRCALDHPSSLVADTRTCPPSPPFAQNGIIWVGRQSMAAGRAGEAPSIGLTEDLVSKGFEADRLKTGTPARVDSRTVDFSVMEAQPGEEEDRWFSFDPLEWKPREQMCCYLTRTTAETHRLINENLLETPVYGGWVTGKGPRYCPSIEDKIVRFKDKESHQARHSSQLTLSCGPGSIAQQGPAPCRAVSPGRLAGLG